MTAREVSYESTYTANGEIAPAVDGPDSNGWRKDTVWVTDGAGCGDDQVGAAFDARYIKDNGDGTFAMVTETYFVERCETSNQPEVVPALSIVGQYAFVVCTDLDDPGMSEIWADYEYDHEVDVRFHFNLAEAEGLCRKHAMADQRFTLSWNGSPR